MGRMCGQLHHDPKLGARASAGSTGVLCNGRFGGGKGIRTPGLTDANRTLYQLSYTPKEPRSVPQDVMRYKQRFRILRCCSCSEVYPPL
jgi:hypothetical protein